MLTLFAVMKGIVGREPGQTYGLGLSLGWYFTIFLKVFREQNKIRHIINYGFKLNHLCSTDLLLISSIYGLLREEAAESQVS